MPKTSTTPQSNTSRVAHKRYAADFSARYQTVAKLSHSETLRAGQPLTAAEPTPQQPVFAPPDRTLRKVVLILFALIGGLFLLSFLAISLFFVLILFL